ncbi:MAG: hypothetical protein ACT4QG_13090 [Sporichthyaceae bacterium]
MTLRDDARVKAWFVNAHHDELPPEKQDELLDVLGGFLDEIGKSPDELVEFCFLRKKDTGERFLSQKRRAEVNEQIDAYVRGRGWVEKQAVVKANVIRGFMVHNGVLIQGAVWTRG